MTERKHLDTPGPLVGEVRKNCQVLGTLAFLLPAMSARKIDILTQIRHRMMKLYANVIARSQHQGSKLPQHADAYSHTPGPRKLSYLSDMTLDQLAVGQSTYYSFGYLSTGSRVA